MIQQYNSIDMIQQYWYDNSRLGEGGDTPRAIGYGSHEPYETHVRGETSVDHAAQHGDVDVTSAQRNYNLLAYSGSSKSIEHGTVGEGGEGGEGACSTYAIIVRATLSSCDFALPHTSFLS